VASQDSPKVPEVGSGIKGVYSVLEALKRDRPRTAQGYVHVGPALLEEAADLLEKSVPISALLSAAAIEALARSAWNVNGRLKGDPDWSNTYPHDRDTWMAEARRDLEAVVEQVGGGQGE
jgi:hypothetical protein